MKELEISPDSSGYQTQQIPRASLKYIDLRLSYLDQPALPSC